MIKTITIPNKVKYFIVDKDDESEIKKLWHSCVLLGTRSRRMNEQEFYDDYISASPDVRHFLGWCESREEMGTYKGLFRLLGITNPCTIISISI